MKRHDENLEVTVYKYDLFPPINWGPEAEDELRKQADLWNRLCVIERDYVAAVRAVASPAVAEIDAELAPKVARIDAALTERRQLRKAGKSKVKTPELDTEITQLKEEIKALRDRAKVLRKDAYETNKDTLKELDKQRYASVKDAYHSFGAFWSNSNAIIASYDRARGRALKGGRGLHERPFNGEGRFSNQIQGGMTVQKLLSGANTQVQLAEKPAWLRAKHAGRGKKNSAAYTLRFKIRSTTDEAGKRDSIYLSFPLILYRPLPEDALIKDVVISRRRLGPDRFIYSVIFTLTRSKPEHEPRFGLPVAINLGWRKMPDGLRVATAVQWAKSGQFEEPLHTTLDHKIMQGFEDYEEVQSERDNARNQIVAELKQVLVENVPEELLGLWSELHANSRITSGFLCALYDKWNNPNGECRFWSERLLSRLAAWHHGVGGRHKPSPGITRADYDFGMTAEQRAASIRTEFKQRVRSISERVRMFGERGRSGMQKEQANRRRGLEAARLYFYRLEARRLIGDASLVVINEHNMADTARKENSTLPPPARRQRFIAAPSVLRQAIVNFCRSNGVELRVFKSEGVEHWRCGLPVNPTFPDELRQLCPHCHEYFEVNENFCMRMLRQTGIPTTPRAKAA